MTKPMYIDLGPHLSREVSVPYVSERHESIRLERNQRLGVSIYNEADDKDTVVQFLAWSGYGTRPDEIQRGKAMAQALDATLVTVDTPGVGPTNSNLNFRQLGDLYDGHLGELSEMQVVALQGAHVDLGRLSIFGYSLGTVLSAAAVPHLPTDISVEKLALIEPVAIAQTHWLKLSTDFLLDGMKDKEYKSANPEWYRKHKEVFPTKQTGALVQYMNFMARNEAFGPLEHNGTVARGADTTVVSAEDSRLLSFSNAEQLATRLGAEHWVLKGENHAVLNDLGRITRLLELLRKYDRL